jgi:hypothetical protein
MSVKTAGENYAIESGYCGKLPGITFLYTIAGSL